jgi:hypothetical protein
MKTTGEPHHVDGSEDVLLTTIKFPVLCMGVERCLRDRKGSLAEPRAPAYMCRRLRIMVWWHQSSEEQDNVNKTQSKKQQQEGQPRLSEWASTYRGQHRGRATCGQPC